MNILRQNENSSALMNNNIFNYNKAYFGGAIFNKGYYLPTDNNTYENKFYNNSAEISKDYYQNKLKIVLENDIQIQ